MLTDVGVPALRVLHRATFFTWRQLGRFEDYLWRWRNVLGDA